MQKKPFRSVFTCKYAKKYTCKNGSIELISRSQWLTFEIFILKLIYTPTQRKMYAEKALQVSIHMQVSMSIFKISRSVTYFFRISCPRAQIQTRSHWSLFMYKGHWDHYRPACPKYHGQWYTFQKSTSVPPSWNYKVVDAVLMLKCFVLLFDICYYISCCFTLHNVMSYKKAIHKNIKWTVQTKYLP